MRKLTKQQNSPAVGEIVVKRVKEGTLLAVCGLAVFLVVALATYNTADPGWSRATSSSGVFNAAGRLGAWLADFLFSFFGYIAYMTPILIGLFGVLLFKAYNLNHRFGWLWILQTFGLIATLASACGLVDICVGLQVNRQLPAGGIVGNLLSLWLTPRLNEVGSGILLGSTFLIGLTVGAGVSWLRLMELLGKAVIKSVTNTAETIETILRKQPQPEQQEVREKRETRETRLTARAAIEPELDLFSVDSSEASEPVFRAAAPATRSIQVTPPPKTAPTIKRPLVANNALPDLDLLEIAPPTDPKRHYSMAMLDKLSREVEERLADFGVEVKVVAVSPGPIITRFEMTLAPGLKVSKITGLAKDLARSLSVTSVRVVEIIPGKAVVGLEIPNQYREVVKLREVLESPQYQEKEGPLTIALGKDIGGVPMVVNLAQMPHLLVAGTTGSGKSVGVNAMLLSLLYKATPADLRLILIDPKMLELSIYDGIGHLLTPVVTDMNDAANALRWCVAEMERRYQLMAALGVRNLAGYNAKVIQANIDGKPILDPFWDPNSPTPAERLEKLPYVVVIIDEFADMMMVVGKKVEELIARIAQKARAAGIHLILATQRPSVDVITGLIKANIPTRIAFQVSSRIDSRTILDQQGAEQLLGHGDMLYLAPGTGIPIRVHGAFVSDAEVHAVVHAIKQNTPAPDYIEEIASSSLAIAGIDANSDLGGEQDPLYDEAVSIVTETRKASISYLQRRLKIGYNRSARLIEAMESAGVVSEMMSNGAREVLAFETPRK